MCFLADTVKINRTFSNCTLSEGCKLQHYRIGSQEAINRESERALIITSSLSVGVFVMTIIVVGILYKVQSKREREVADSIRHELAEASSNESPELPRRERTVSYANTEDV